MRLTTEAEIRRRPKAMILSLDELITRLRGGADQGTNASMALWIRFTQDKTAKTVEYRTAGGNEITHVYLDGNGALVGIEIFS
jgi:hypothetical protein